MLKLIDLIAEGLIFLNVFDGVSISRKNTDIVSVLLYGGMPGSSGSSGKSESSKE